ncbi:MAG: hypothetical protein AAGF79_17700 [Pseudomonadota bacterium]
MAEILFVLSVAFAHAMTNLDNIAVVLVLSTTVGIRRCVSAFALTQVICILLAAGIGAAAIDVLGAWVGYVGLLPIALGVYTLWRGGTVADAVPTREANSMGALMIVFFSLGLDTIMIMSAIFADSAVGWRALAYLGAAVSLSAMVALLLVMTYGDKATRIIERLNRFAPYALIAVGLYILSNTITDAV